MDVFFRNWFLYQGRHFFTIVRIRLNVSRNFQFNFENTINVYSLLFRSIGNRKYDEAETEKLTYIFNMLLHFKQGQFQGKNCNSAISKQSTLRDQLS